MSTTTPTPPKPPPRIAKQDVAPPGGYAPININRNVPRSVSRNSAIALLVGGGAVISYGFYRVGHFNLHRRALKQEKKDIRLAITPLLQAEEDARFVEERKKYLAWEAELMKDNPDWKADDNVYKTRNFTPPFLSSVPYAR